MSVVDSWYCRTPVGDEIIGGIIVVAFVGVSILAVVPCRLPNDDLAPIATDVAFSCGLDRTSRP